MRISIGSAVLALVVAGTACGKAKTSDSHDEPAAPTAKAVAPAASATSVISAKQLVGLPLHADASDGWKLEADPVTKGARLSTPDDEISIRREGVDGLGKTTIDAEKKLVTGTPQEVKEETLSDGWLYSYKVPGILPYHAAVFRTLGDQSYRCFVTASSAAQQSAGIAVCKSLRP